MRGSSIEINPKHKRLLNYVVKYLSTFRKTSGRGIVETLILTYAKQLVTGVTDGVVRGKLMALINDAEEEA